MGVLLKFPADDHRPLPAHVPVSKDRIKYPNCPSFRRTLSISIGAFFSLLVVLLVFPDFLATEFLTFSEIGQRAFGRCLTSFERVPLDTLEEVMLNTPNEDKVKEWSQYYTSGPHLAGKNYSQAVWTKDRFEEFGISAEIVTYEIYTNYPISHRLALLQGKGAGDLNVLKGSDDIHDEKAFEVVFEASLEEEILETDPTTGLKDRIPTFHGYSANGNVTAEYIWANYGTFRDYEDLTRYGVNLTGKIVICRYGKVFRGLKVKRAQELGAIGVLIYSDPGDDGKMTELNGFKPYPDGPARNRNSVQRGSVQFLSYAPGDPTTIGRPSLPGVPRDDPHVGIPAIPSLPISYADAIPILKALNSHGLSFKDLGGDWNTGGLWHEGVEYNIGPAPGMALHLVNEMEFVITPQWDVIAKIEGHIKDQAVIVGNHRDAWIAGGAGDPNSGSAALLEMARSFGKMLKDGWKPLRPIVLASWDGEEYGLLGSTEWVEDHAKWLSRHALAYINVDVAARSPILKTSANPLLHDVLVDALKKVQDPSTLDREEKKSVYDLWEKRISTIGSGSDYTSFQDFLGIPSLDMGFGGIDDGVTPIYHYHSNYDSFTWMEKYGDPGFNYHTTMTKIWGLITLNLVEQSIVPFNATSYAIDLSSYLTRIVHHLPSNITINSSRYSLKKHPDHPPHPPPHHPPHHKYPHHPPCDHPDSKLQGILGRRLHLLNNSIHHLQDRAEKFDKRTSDLAEQLRDPELSWWKKVYLLWKARGVNVKYQMLDRVFLYEKGLDDRNVFKHVVYAPGRWTGYSGDVFPGLSESIEDRNWTNALRWTHIIQQTVDKAGALLI